MNRSKSQADNITMSAGGVYSFATIGAKDVVVQGTPLVLSALSGQMVSLDEHWSALI